MKEITTIWSWDEKLQELCWRRWKLFPTDPSVAWRKKQLYPLGDTWGMGFHSHSQSSAACLLGIWDRSASFGTDQLWSPPIDTHTQTHTHLSCLSDALLDWVGPRGGNHSKLSNKSPGNHWKSLFSDLLYVNNPTIAAELVLADALKWPPPLGPERPPPPTTKSWLLECSNCCQRACRIFCVS